MYFDGRARGSEFKHVCERAHLPRRTRVHAETSSTLDVVSANTHCRAPSEAKATKNRADGRGVDATTSQKRARPSHIPPVRLICHRRSLLGRLLGVAGLVGVSLGLVRLQGQQTSRRAHDGRSCSGSVAVTEKKRPGLVVWLFDQDSRTAFSLSDMPDHCLPSSRPSSVKDMSAASARW